MEEPQVVVDVNASPPADITQEFVSIRINDQLFGILVSRIHDVLNAQSITQVPLSQTTIAGVLNLRGKIVTAIDLGAYLGLGKRADYNNCMSIVVEYNDESYSLLVDSVGEVLNLSTKDHDPNPANLNKDWQKITSGVYRLDSKLLVALDIDKVLSFENFVV